ncbi:MAG: hypothetical protein IPK13_20660 [Deltaproteobacteria bacterium]|nr:hypothetical protein [Deltaproteobacteria bacterium]
MNYYAGLHPSFLTAGRIPLEYAAAHPLANTQALAVANAPGYGALYGPSYDGVGYDGLGYMGPAGEQPSAYSDAWAAGRAAAAGLGGLAGYNALSKGLATDFLRASAPNWTKSVDFIQKHGLDKAQDVAKNLATTRAGQIAANLGGLPREIGNNAWNGLRAIPSQVAAAARPDHAKLLQAVEASLAGRPPPTAAAIKSAVESSAHLVPEAARAKAIDSVARTVTKRQGQALAQKMASQKIPAAGVVEELKRLGLAADDRVAKNVAEKAVSSAAKGVLGRGASIAGRLVPGLAMGYDLNYALNVSKDPKASGVKKFFAWTTAALSTANGVASIIPGVNVLASATLGSLSFLTGMTAAAVD